MLAQAVEKLSYLAGIAVRRDDLPLGTDCVCFYLHGLFLAAQMSDRSDKSDKSDKSDIKPPPRLCRSQLIAVFP